MQIMGYPEGAWDEGGYKIRLPGGLFLHHIGSSLLVHKLLFAHNLQGILESYHKKVLFLQPGNPYPGKCNSAAVYTIRFRGKSKKNTAALISSHGPTNLCRPAKGPHSALLSLVCFTSIC